MLKNPLYMGVLFMVLTTFVASTAAAMSKHIGQMASVEQVVFFQYLICFLLVAQLVRKPRQLQVGPDDIFAMLVRALSGLVAFYSYFLAIRYIPLVEATLLRTSSPLFIPLLGFLWLHTQIRLQHFLFLLMGLAGIVIILNPGISVLNAGHLLGLVSGVTVALSVISTRKLANSYRPQVILFYHYLVSTLGMLPLALSHWQPLHGMVWFYLLYIGIAVHFSLYFYTRALGLACANSVAPIIYLSVVFAGLFDALIWQYTPSLVALSGMSLVVLAGILATRFSAKNPV
ncbi:MAG: DMT family transporter [Pseudomonadales bacterium]|nr:DMT family transporter [Pseudomonadales bacterium]